jgi:hypothetical protein
VEEKRIKKIKYFNTCILKKERKGEKNNAFVECHQLTLVMAALQPFQKLKKRNFSQNYQYASIPADTNTSGVI